MNHGSDHPTVFLTKINAIMRKLITLLFVLSYILNPPGPVYGQETMDAAERQTVVDSLIKTLADHYVFPDVAQKMGDHLRKKHKAGAFNDLANPVAFYLKAKAEPVVLTEEQLESCTGQFGPRSLLQKDGRLFYQRSGRPEMELVILNPTTFVLKEDPNIRFSVEIDRGKAHALVLESVDGWREKTERTDAQP